MSTPLWIKNTTYYVLTNKTGRGRYLCTSAEEAFNCYKKQFIEFPILDGNDELRAKVIMDHEGWSIRPVKIRLEEVESN